VRETEDAALRSVSDVMCRDRIEWAANKALQTDERRVSVAVYRDINLAPLAAERQNR